MSKQKFVKVDNRSWVYMVYLLGSPNGCFSNAASAVAFVQYFLSYEGGNPLKEGDVKVVRYRLCRDARDLTEQDITETVLRVCSSL